MDPPPLATLITALEQLYTLGALDDEGLLTRLGRRMAEFPVDPRMSKALLAAVDFGAADEVLSVIAMLSVQNIFHRPKARQAAADAAKARFHQAEGDHMTLLHVYQTWVNNRCSNPWCFEHFIQARSMRRAQDVRKQLVGLLDRHRLPILSAGRKRTRVLKAITSGFFAHVARKDPQEGYKTVVDNQPVYVYPGSALFGKQPQWVLYHQLVLTSKEYMREVTAIDPRWLLELAPKFFKKPDPTRLSRRKRAEKIEPLYDKYGDGDMWRLSKRRG
eukprot:PLAT9128.1.p1 GENE.PLAT9128.1~~PLAT9128.1.p1  ORF type:complete len:298 (-),score=182.02 PLAT9128.1:260-1081(-)